MLDVFDTAYEAPYATPTSVKAVHPPPPSLLQRLRSAVPFVGRTTDPVKDGKWQGKRSPTVFTRLKGGTRDAILAVVDNGLISFLVRFWPMSSPGCSWTHLVAEVYRDRL